MGQYLIIDCGQVVYEHSDKEIASMALFRRRRGALVEVLAICTTELLHGVADHQEIATKRRRKKIADH